MRILIVAATECEISALRPDLKPGVDVLVTGVGMVSTGVRCARALALTQYDLALNVGICGSFDHTLGPGSVVHVVRDNIAELGAEDNDEFVTIEAIRLPAEWSFFNSAPPPLAAPGANSGSFIGLVVSDPTAAVASTPVSPSLAAAAGVPACPIPTAPASARSRVLSNVPV